MLDTQSSLPQYSHSPSPSSDNEFENPYAGMGEDVMALQLAIAAAMSVPETQPSKDFLPQLEGPMVFQDESVLEDPDMLLFASGLSINMFSNEFSNEFSTEFSNETLLSN